eukprot:TRINITY_DN1234_c0_g2_i2.p3 TRINITY_DN1234_c0_g2~~TRINITY_DN1234_c0_g2_i2.p3  ORF type:complete len:60 (-),score=11.48 TRINITY_DN1234_c0_g2_i2:3-182(-)
MDESLSRYPKFLKSLKLFDTSFSVSQSISRNKKCLHVEKRKSNRTSVGRSSETAKAHRG